MILYSADKGVNPQPRAASSARKAGLVSHSLAGDLPKIAYCWQVRMVLEFSARPMAGIGIMRTSGFRDLSIHVLATVPEWNERETVFAATDTGLYRSPNAGRSGNVSTMTWKAASFFQ